MEHSSFPSDVIERLGWYVYRLIDPRNGETFYVGKGRGNRVFQHVQSALATLDDEDQADLKYQRIKEINSTGLAVAHVIHRHGIETEETAYQIEAALIDAYPGLTNKVGGHGAGDYGSRHAAEIIAEYAAKPFVAREPLILISIGRSFEDETLDIYEAVRAAWKINERRASTYRLVLAHRRGLVVGAFRPTRWLPATRQHFPRLDTDIPARWGFEGVRADDVEGEYLRTRVPDVYRARGASNPVRFVEP